MNPGEAMMRGRGCENGLGLAEFAVDLFEALQEPRQGAGADGDMVADLNIVIAQRAGDHFPAFDPQQMPWVRYTLRFRVLCWDERWNYMSFEFLQDGRTMAMGHAKGAIVGRLGIIGRADRFDAIGSNAESPAFPESVSAWIEAERLIHA
jgi:hypothetical protein